MLVLTRKIGEGIAIGDDVRVVVMQVKGKQVRLGIKASPSTLVHREEVYEKIRDENELASQATAAMLETAPDALRGSAAPGSAPLKTRGRPVPAK